jgi:hypothetical protein
MLTQLPVADSRSGYIGYFYMVCRPALLGKFVFRKKKKPPDGGFRETNILNSKTGYFERMSERTRR